METKNWKSALASTRVRLMIGAALIVLLTAAALWWVFGSREQLLFGNLREADAAEIVASLNEWKVPYTIVDNGKAITVPSDQVYDVRMRLVSAGVPKGGHVGFELFNDADFGVTEFAQRVNYQRALQGELERTISSMPGVQTARVHLTIRRPGLFVGETESSKASVAVSLAPGDTLGASQISGIRSLIAASVEGLQVGDVSVLDSSGALLAGANGGQGSVEGRTDEEGRLETRIQARVAEMLGTVITDGRFHVAVDVELNFDTVRQVNERPLVQRSGDDAVLVRRRVNSVDAPGAAGRSQNQEEAEYAHGTAREEISRAPGRVQRLSVAVALPSSLDEFEVERIRSLVAASAGIDEERGDRLEVSRVNWQPEPLTGVRAVDVDNVATPPRSDAFDLRTHLWKLAVVAAIGLLLGAMAVAATVRRPRRLSAAEREAVVLKLRGWLAEGRLPS